MKAKLKVKQFENGKYEEQFVTQIDMDGNTCDGYSTCADEGDALLLDTDKDTVQIQALATYIFEGSFGTELDVDDILSLSMELVPAEPIKIVVQPPPTQAQLKMRETIGDLFRKIEIHTRGTPEGDAQRERFKSRWGIYPKEGA
ncbi:MAG: hypothetical protein AB7G93_10055 [Bdellovibrionales bacterium]